MYVHFNHGNLVRDKTIVIDTHAKYAMIGTLHKTHLVEAEMVDLEKIAEYHCMPVLKLPLKDPNEIDGRRQKILSPFTINSDMNLQRIMIRTSKIMFYNKVTRSASNSIAALFFDLDKKNHFTVNMYPSAKIVSVADDESLKWQIRKFLRINRPMVWVQHYNFIDFSKFGYTWNPDWFNVVRDPIEKVISMFYYRRAGWVIVHRLNKMPNEGRETVEWYKMDFESCVLKGKIYFILFNKESEFCTDAISTDYDLNSTIIVLQMIPSVDSFRMR